MKGIMVPLLAMLMTTTVIAQQPASNPAPTTNDPQTLFVMLDDHFIQGMRESHVYIPIEPNTGKVLIRYNPDLTKKLGEPTEAPVSVLGVKRDVKNKNLILRLSESDIGHLKNRGLTYNLLPGERNSFIQLILDDDFPDPIPQPTSNQGRTQGNRTGGAFANNGIRNNGIRNGTQNNTAAQRPGFDPTFGGQRPSPDNSNTLLGDPNRRQPAGSLADRGNTFQPIVDPNRNQFRDAQQNRNQNNNFGETRQVGYNNGAAGNIDRNAGVVGNRGQNNNRFGSGSRDNNFQGNQTTNPHQGTNNFALNAPRGTTTQPQLTYEEERLAAEMAQAKADLDEFERQARIKVKRQELARMKADALNAQQRLTNSNLEQTDPFINYAMQDPIARQTNQMPRRNQQDLFDNGITPIEQQRQPPGNRTAMLPNDQTRGLPTMSIPAADASKVMHSLDGTNNPTATVAQQRATDQTNGFLGFLLLCSIGLNVYLLWISRGFYVRYAELADELRETFTSTM